MRPSPAVNATVGRWRTTGRLHGLALNAFDAAVGGRGVDGGEAVGRPDAGVRRAGAARAVRVAARVEEGQWLGTG